MDITDLVIELIQVREVFGDLRVIMQSDGELPWHGHEDKTVTGVVVQPADKDGRRTVRLQFNTAGTAVVDEILPGTPEWDESERALEVQRRHGG